MTIKRRKANESSRWEVIAVALKPSDELYCTRRRPVFRNITTGVCASSLQKQNSFYNFEEILDYAKQGRISLLVSPTPAKEDGLMLVVNETMLNVLGLDYRRKVFEQSVVKEWRAFIDYHDVWAGYAPEPELNIFLDEWAEALFTHGIELFKQHWQTLQSSEANPAAAVFTMARQAAHTASIRYKALVAYCLRYLDSDTSYKIDNLFTLRISKQFPEITREQFENDMSNLLNEIV